MSDALPPFGAFVAEQYLIRNWDHTAQSTAAEQRDKLLRQYLQLDEIPKEWDSLNPDNAGINMRIPSAEEINIILRPWRSDAIRKVAAEAWKKTSDIFTCFWLRTHYDNAQNEIWENMILDSQMCSSEDFMAYALDEEASFSSDGLDPFTAWAKAILLIPELAKNGNQYECSRAWDSDSNEFKQFQAELYEEVKLRALEDRIGWIEYTETAKNLQIYFACQRSVVIGDAEAFATGEMCQLLLDSWGNVVRWMRIPVEDMMEPPGYHMRAILPGIPWMEEGEKSGLGIKYRARGDMGKLLYNVEELLDSAEE